ncbi:hypothetical protein CC85DRAFT_85580 [Cutaneotrichosporon oleaginosum]|uniref:Uncharacterized protein n=1 Tax=Cutaneotrichosporon oleaginosum TaxID=879819 RepID=A0A0J1B491_9TREE|nr:uncharacterized protein CC85DRAFT_85580 [Cutaneotrichosporon oleaginosum]KLT42464.1 hypothetical protein CC85DRAFT_85580 [Cutaneotrichosporon oleaginosum]TXT06983.1 hypothetical protein COLE_06314 [Cutaneotrichosporon oleaginosum]
MIPNVRGHFTTHHLPPTVHQNSTPCALLRYLRAAAFAKCAAALSALLLAISARMRSRSPSLAGTWHQGLGRGLLPTTSRTCFHDGCVRPYVS